MRGKRGDVLAVERDLAAAADKARDGVDEGRLAGAVGADQADQLAGLDVEVDVDDGVHATEGDGDAAGGEDGGGRGAHQGLPASGVASGFLRRTRPVSRSSSVGIPAFFFCCRFL